MEQNIKQLIQAIHDAPERIVMVAAGAGTEALSNLLGVAGATRTLLEALVPYSTAAFDDFLGRTPAKYVTERTARLLAGRAFTRARWLDAAQNPVLGLACTATIVTDRPKRGEHRAYIATWQPDRLVEYGIHLNKGLRDRAGEENLVSSVLLNALAEGMSLDVQLPVSLTDKDKITITTHHFGQAAQKISQGKLNCFGVTADGRIRSKHIKPQALLSGSFNPLHDGHLELLQVSAKLLGHPVAFECAAKNVDKPAIPARAMVQRIAQFAGRWPVYVTNAATYVEKARIFPNTVFVIGFDTAERILHPRYYQNSESTLRDALAEIEAQGCSFLVAGRQDKNGVFRNSDQLNVPHPFANLFKTIPAEAFRKDISSTELRATGQRGSR
jgi:Cytidylyltransferase-like